VESIYATYVANGLRWLAKVMLAAYHFTGCSNESCASTWGPIKRQVIVSAAMAETDLSLAVSPRLAAVLIATGRAAHQFPGRG
jgi:hypothetical protein